MKKLILLTVLLTIFTSLTSQAQNVQIDGRLQPLLNEFFEICKSYNLDYHDKLFKLESIDIVNTLTVSEEGSTLGMLVRNDLDEVKSIDISWMAQIDPQILKIVAFHEFAHYFLEYSTHICHDCGKIMSVVNSSYFDIAQDWDYQVRVLFEDSPAYQNKFNSSVSTVRVSGNRP